MRTAKTRKRTKKKRSGIKQQIFFTLLASAALASNAYPQAQAPVVGQAGTETIRSIQGTVLNDKGAPVPGAVILLKDTKTLQVRSFIARSNGQYHFNGLSSDINYELRAESNGMTSSRKMVSVFDSRKTVTLNLKLKKKIKADS
jgi:Carboxypeptidase regulatory-like domain